MHYHLDRQAITGRDTYIVTTCRKDDEWIAIPKNANWSLMDPPTAFNINSSDKFQRVSYLITKHKRNKKFLIM